MMGHTIPSTVTLIRPTIAAHLPNISGGIIPHTILEPAGLGQVKDTTVDRGNIVYKKNGNKRTHKNKIEISFNRNKSLKVVYVVLL